MTLEEKYDLLINHMTILNTPWNYYRAFASLYDSLLGTEIDKDVMERQQEIGIDQEHPQLSGENWMKYVRNSEQIE